MAQSTKFFFQLTQNSTELYREAHNTQFFNFKSFFQQPQSSDLFLEVQYSSDEEQSIFNVKPTQSFSFPNQLTHKFSRIVSKHQEESEEESQVYKKQKSTRKTTKRKKRITKKVKSTKKKVQAQSQITKNACCNIVQKTISLIKKGEYQQKLEQICNQFSVNVKEFIAFIVSQKTRFTGTKALQLFLSTETKQCRVFAQFLGWFLRQKYIRHAIMSGEMTNLKAYIKFKNEVILPLL